MVKPLDYWIASQWLTIVNDEWLGPSSFVDVFFGRKRGSPPFKWIYTVFPLRGKRNITAVARGTTLRSTSRGFHRPGY